MQGIHAKLLGTPACRRYEKMRQVVEQSAAKAGVDVFIEEVNDTAALAQSNPLNLPQLYIQGELIASKNPPQPRDLEQILRSKFPRI